MRSLLLSLLLACVATAAPLPFPKKGFPQPQLRVGCYRTGSMEVVLFGDGAAELTYDEPLPRAGWRWEVRDVDFVIWHEHPCIKFTMNRSTLRYVGRGE